MKNEDGYVLVVSIVMLIVFIILLAAMSSLIANEVDFVGHSKNSIKTFYIAEAGLEYASTFLGINDIDDTDIWGNGIDNLNTDLVNNVHSLDSNVTLNYVTKETVNDEITLTSKATHENGSDKIIKAVFNREAIVSDVFKKSLVANGNIDLKNKITITGDPDPDYGNVYTTGEIITHNQTTFVDAEPEANQSESIIPPIYDVVNAKVEAGDLNTFSITDIQDENNNDLYDFGNAGEGSGPTVVKVNESITFKNTSILQGHGILLVDGDVTFNNGAVINTGTYIDTIINESGEPEEITKDENLLIIVNGSVEFKNSAEFSGMVYASEKVDIKAKVDITGTLISDQILDNTTLIVHSGGNEASTVTYNNSYLEVFDALKIDRPSLGGGLNYSLTILEWEES